MHAPHAQGCPVPESRQMWIHGNRKKGMFPKTCIWLDGSACYRAGQEALLRLHPSHGRPAGNPYTRMFQGSICFFLRPISSTPPPALAPLPQGHWEDLLCTLGLDPSVTLINMSSFLNSGSSGSELAPGTLPPPCLPCGPASSSFSHLGSHPPGLPSFVSGESWIIDRPSYQPASLLGGWEGAPSEPRFLSSFITPSSRNTPGHTNHGTNHQQLWDHPSLSLRGVSPQILLGRAPDGLEGARADESDAEFAARLAASLQDNSHFPYVSPKATPLPAAASSSSASWNEDGGIKKPSAPPLPRIGQQDDDSACVVCLTAPLHVRDTRSCLILKSSMF